MAKDKISEYSATNSANTVVGDIDIDEGCLPSGINNAIREVMTHLKDLSDGTSGVDVLNLQDDDASASIKIQAPAAVTTTTTFTLPDGDGTSGQVLQTSGTGTLSWTSNGLANVVEDTTPQLGGNLDTNGNDINFGDDDKAIFGSALDGLQIYNTAAGDKFISEAGGGNLKVQGDNLYLQNSAGTENYIIAISNAAVTLHYDSAAKLATTATGINVTGTATATAFSGDGSALTGIQAGAGYFQGENGATGDTTNGKGDIFRTHQSQLDTNVTIASGDNSLCAGPLTIATGVTLTVNGNLVIA
jgi:hypothetical protein